MCSDSYLTLLEWQNTPTAGMGSSPSLRLFSRRMRGGLLTSPERLLSEIQGDMWARKIRKQQARQKPPRVHLEPLWVGQPVLVQDWLSNKTQWTRGRCVGQLPDRSYIVEVDGQILRRRNRVLLRPTSHLPDRVLDQQGVTRPESAHSACGGNNCTSH